MKERKKERRNETFIGTKNTQKQMVKQKQDITDDSMQVNGVRAVSNPHWY